MHSFKARNPQTQASNLARTVQSVCPGCGSKTNFVLPPGQFVDLTDRSSGGTTLTLYGLRLCPAATCQSLIFFARDSSGDDFIFPFPQTLWKVQYVPKEIEDDAKEAMACLGVSAWKGTVLLCRRAVEATCEEQKAKGPNLKAQIENLEQTGLINKTLKDWADQIRFFGNLAAHPDPAFGSVTKSDAESMIDFMTLFLTHIYEMPGKIKQAQTRSGKS